MLALHNTCGVPNTHEDGNNNFVGLLDGLFSSVKRVSEWFFELLYILLYVVMIKINKKR